MCPCLKGIQDPEHLLKTCTFTEPMRQKVLSAIKNAVMTKGSPNDKTKMAGMEDLPLIMSTLPSTPKFSTQTEKAIKNASSNEWKDGLVSLALSLEGMNSGVTAETAACTNSL